MRKQIKNLSKKLACGLLALATVVSTVNYIPSVKTVKAETKAEVTEVNSQGSEYDNLSDSRKKEICDGDFMNTPDLYDIDVKTTPFNEIAFIVGRNQMKAIANWYVTLTNEEKDILNENIGLFREPIKPGVYCEKEGVYSYYNKGYEYFEALAKCKSIKVQINAVSGKVSLHYYINGSIVANSAVTAYIDFSGDAAQSGTAGSLNTRRAYSGSLTFSGKTNFIELLDDTYATQGTDTTIRSLGMRKADGSLQLIAGSADALAFNFLHLKFYINSPATVYPSKYASDTFAEIWDNSDIPDLCGVYSTESFVYGKGSSSEGNYYIDLYQSADKTQDDSLNKTGYNQFVFSVMDMTKGTNFGILYNATEVDTDTWVKWTVTFYDKLGSSKKKIVYYANETKKKIFSEDKSTQITSFPKPSDYFTGSTGTAKVYAGDKLVETVSATGEFKEGWYGLSYTDPWAVYKLTKAQTSFYAYQTFDYTLASTNGVPNEYISTESTTFMPEGGNTAIAINGKTVYQAPSTTISVYAEDDYTYNLPLVSSNSTITLPEQSDKTYTVTNAYDGTTATVTAKFNDYILTRNTSPTHYSKGNTITNFDASTDKLYVTYNNASYTLPVKKKNVTVTFDNNVNSQTKEASVATYSINGTRSGNAGENVSIIQDTTIAPLTWTPAKFTLPAAEKTIQLTRQGDTTLMQKTTNTGWYINDDTTKEIVAEGEFETDVDVSAKVSDWKNTTFTFSAPEKDVTIYPEGSNSITKKATLKNGKVTTGVNVQDVEATDGMFEVSTNADSNFTNGEWDDAIFKFAAPEKDVTLYVDGSTNITRKAKLEEGEITPYESETATPEAVKADNGSFTIKSTKDLTFTNKTWGDATFTLPKNAPEKEGYMFTGWKDEDGNSYNLGDTVTTSTDKELTAKWSKIEYNLTIIDSYNHTVTTNAALDYNPESTYNHLFAGYTDMEVNETNEDEAVAKFPSLSIDAIKDNVSESAKEWNGSVCTITLYVVKTKINNPVSGTTNNNIDTIIVNISSGDSVSASDLKELADRIETMMPAFKGYADSIIKAIQDSTAITAEQKEQILAHLASGYLTDEDKELLKKVIEASALTDAEKASIVTIINKSTTLPYDTQLILYNTLASGGSVNYDYDGITYRVTKNDDNTVSVGVENFGDKKEVTIPNEITLAGHSFPVTAINDKGFYNDKALEIIHIPNNVQTIGVSAFEGCSNLKTVDIAPSGLTTIKSKAFKNCVSLTSFTCPSTLVVIGSYAFYNCKKMTTFKSNKGLLKICAHAFEKCSSLKQINIPSTLLKIGDYVYKDCVKIAKVVYENKTATQLERLGNGAFMNCKSLTSIYIPSRVDLIKRYVFKGCKKLKKVTGMKIVSTIQKQAFSKCTSLKSFTVVKTIRRIDSKAFYGDKKLKTVTIKGKALSKVGSKAFKKCSKKIKFKVKKKYIKKFTKLLKNKF